MNNKVLTKFIIGLLLINLEFIMYNTVRFFSLIPLIIIFHFIFLVVIARNWNTKSTYSLYTIAILLSYIYSLYTNINAIFYIICAIYLVWYTQKKIVPTNGTTMFVNVIKLFIIIFTIRSFIYIIRYNINIDIMTVITINTLACAIINGLITYAMLKVFSNKQEMIEDHN